MALKWAAGVVPCTSCPIKGLHLLPAEAVAMTRVGGISLTVYDDCVNGAFPVHAECSCSDCDSEQDLVPTCFGGILCMQHAMQHCTPVGIAATGVLERQMSAVRQMRDELVHELWGCLHAADKDAHASSSIAIRLAKAVQGAARVHVAFLSIAEKIGRAHV